jgi:hypothetical protein
LGRVRSLVWDRYGSITGVGLSDRQIRDAWMADGTATSFGVLANAWKEGPCGTRWPTSARTGKPRRLRSGGGSVVDWCRRLSGNACTRC